MPIKAYLKYFSRAGCGPCAQFTGDGKTSVWAKLDSDAELLYNGIKTEKIFFDQTGKEAPRLEDLDARYTKFVRSVPCLYLHAPNDLERGMLYTGDRSNAQIIKTWINNNVSAVISANSIGNTGDSTNTRHIRSETYNNKAEPMNNTQRTVTTVQRRSHQPSTADLAKYEQVIREHQEKLAQLNQISKTDMSHTVRSIATTNTPSETLSRTTETLYETDRIHGPQRPIAVETRSTTELRNMSTGVTNMPSAGPTLDKHIRPVDRSKQKREFVSGTTAGLGNLHQTHSIGADVYNNDRSMYSGAVARETTEVSSRTTSCGCASCPNHDVVQSRVTESHISEITPPLLQSGSIIITRPVRIFGKH